MHESAVHAEPTHKNFEGWAQHLLEQSTKWTPVDRTIPDSQALHHEQQRELSNIALLAGGAILRLAVRKRLELLPRLQTLAFQTRAELRRHVDSGRLPYSWNHGNGFNALIIKLFEDCCGLWLSKKLNSYWRYGREAERAALFARFLTEFAKHLRALPQEVRSDAELAETDTVHNYNALRVIWEQFARDGDAAPLLRFVRAHPGVTRTSGQRYPRLHRIGDVILEEKAYRLLRHVDGFAYLILMPIPLEIAFPDSPGVPYWLKEAPLRRWIADVESGAISEFGSTDWERYR